MPTHVTRWPITDQSMTLRELVNEGSGDLSAILAEHDAVAAGPTAWRIEPGETPTLVATTPVHILPTRKPRKPSPIAKARARSSEIRERLVLALDEHAELSQWELAQLLGVHERTVQRHLAAMRQEHAA